MATALLLLILFGVMGHSLNTMRIAVFVLVALVFALALWGIHARAAGKSGLIFLMKVGAGITVHLDVDRHLVRLDHNDRGRQTGYF